MHSNQNSLLFTDITSTEQANLNGGASDGFSVDLNIDDRSITFDIGKRSKRGKRNKHFVAKLD